MQDYLENGKESQEEQQSDSTNSGEASSQKTTEEQQDSSTLSKEGLQHVVKIVSGLTGIKHEDPNWKEFLESLTIQDDSKE